MKKRNYGFTLAELLIVVAIIAVLVGVSIPVFNGQRRKAQIATVRANIRAARAAAYSEFLTNGFSDSSNTYGYYAYDVKSGIIHFFASYDMNSLNWPNLDDPEVSTYVNHADSKTTYKYNYIYVYIKLASSNQEILDQKADIQTCPYYDEDADDIVYLPGEPYGN